MMFGTSLDRGQLEYSRVVAVFEALQTITEIKEHLFPQRRPVQRALPQLKFS
jgi:hypothetical protein